MPNIQTKNEVFTNKLLQETASLSSQELDNFVNQAIILRAKRNAPNIPKIEAELLLKINQGLPEKQQKRFDELTEKLAFENMNLKEREEFLRLTDEIEKQDAKRIELLGKLAEIREITLDELMSELKIGQN